MGYEVKLYVVRVSAHKEPVSELGGKVFKAYQYEDTQEWYGYAEDGNTKIDVPVPTLALSFSSVIAMVDLCKPGGASCFMQLMEQSPQASSYIYQGDKMVYEDSYGEPMKEASVEATIAAIKKDLLEDSYRRFVTALAVLETFTEERYGDGIRVLFYGY